MLSRNIKNWKNTLKEVKESIDKNKAKPLQSSAEKDEYSLAKWLSNQTTNYKIINTIE